MREFQNVKFYKVDVDENDVSLDGSHFSGVMAS